MLKLLKNIEKKDWIYVLFILVLVVIQVWLDLNFQIICLI